MIAARQLAVAACLCAGCAVDGRDVATRPEPILVDAFEDGTLVPTDTRFNRWASTVFNTDIGDRQYGVASPGRDSGFAMELSWDVTDHPDGVRDYPGALIRTQALGSIDLTGYQTFSFAFRVAQGSGARLESINIGISCYELGTSFGIAQPVGPDWQTVDLPLQSFVEPVWNLTGSKREDCLSRADEFGFATSYNLEDGAQSAGTLFIDDVMLR